MKFVLVFLSLAALLGFSKPTEKIQEKEAEKKVELRLKSKTHRLLPEQSLKIENGYEIKHLGYGHRLGGGSGLAFFEFQVNGPTEERSQKSRVFYPLKKNESVFFGGIQIVFTKCEDTGPPHRKDAGVEFQILPVPTVAPGARFTLKVGEAVFVGNTLSLYLKSIGHDDDDDGGDTLAELEGNNGKTHQGLTLFLKSNVGKSIDWHDWEIQVHEWKNPGPPHGPDQALVMSAKLAAKKAN